VGCENTPHANHVTHQGLQKPKQRQKKFSRLETTSIFGLTIREG
jgi:hypothetical protein